MYRWLRWLAPLLLVSCFASTASAQLLRRPEKPEPPVKTPPALQYLVAVGSTLLILTIVCYPSRKRF